jgi:hypothetical protein
MKTEHRGRLVNTLLRIWDVPGSNLGPGTVYADWDFCGFSTFLQTNSGTVP